MKAIGFAAVVLMVLGSQPVYAGVAPNTGASSAARSGVRIAPTKTEPQSKAQGESATQGDTAK